MTPLDFTEEQREILRDAFCGNYSDYCEDRWAAGWIDSIEVLSDHRNGREDEWLAKIVRFAEMLGEWPSDCYSGWVPLKDAYRLADEFIESRKPKPEPPAITDEERAADLERFRSLTSTLERTRA